uniref:Apoptosis inducing factor mitochondria associated 5 n=1 Tax=Sinocyclocheilus rhinocerous TaxID=307959 RepID=A0A673IZA2_9TELE
MCAETLRQENYGGRIIMISRDDLLPYDKTRLGKIMNAESDSLLMRRMEFFHKYDIEVWLKKEGRALSIDTNKKTVTFDDGLIQCYDQILIATGFIPISNMCLIYNLLTLVCLFFKMLEERGLTFYMNDAVAEVQGENRRVKSTGSFVPKTTRQSFFWKLLTLPKSLIMSLYMRTNITDVYCAGDLTSFPLKMAKGQNVSIGHWQIAQAHGRIAALSMLQREVELNTVPFYWTVLLGRTIRYAGYGEGYTEMVLKGKFENVKFLALYLKDDEVVAAAGLNVEPAVSVVAESLAGGRAITKAEAE